MKRRGIDDDKLYSARDVARLLGVTEPTVTKYCRSRRLKGKQLGPKRRWHVLGADVLRKLREWGVVEDGS